MSKSEDILFKEINQKFKEAINTLASKWFFKRKAKIEVLKWYLVKTSIAQKPIALFPISIEDALLCEGIESDLNSYNTTHITRGEALPEWYCRPHDLQQMDKQVRTITEHYKSELRRLKKKKKQ